MAEKWESPILDNLGLRGRRTHIHAIVSTVAFGSCAYIAHTQTYGLIWVLAFVGLASLGCGLGCIRWTLTGITNTLAEIKNAKK